MSDMNDTIKQRKIFEDQDLSHHKEKNSSQSDIENLATQKLFEPEQAFTPVTINDDDEHLESNLESVVVGRRRRGWVAGTLLGSFAGLVGWQAIDSVITAFNTGDYLTLGWSALITAVASLGIGALGKELLKLRKLRQHFSVQEKARELIERDSVGQGEAFCLKLADEAQLKATNPQLERWKSALNSAHSDAEVLEMYQSMVLSEQDKKALSMVSKLSGEAAILVALSPLAIADMLLIAWRNLTMIDKLSVIYGVELGYWSRLRLFKLVLTNMALAGASELAIESGADVLSLNLAEKLSARAGQGLGVGLLTARLGLKTMTLMRPIPFSHAQRPKLSSVRHSIIAGLKNKLS